MCESLGQQCWIIPLSAWQFRTSEADGTNTLVVAPLYSFCQKTWADHLALSRMPKLEGKLRRGRREGQIDVDPCEHKPD